MDTLLRYKADPSLKLTHGLGSILCVATSFQAERRRTAQERMKLVNFIFFPHKKKRLEIKYELLFYYYHSPENKNKNQKSK